ncbi:hypothetical protein [Methylomonas sp. LWB]|uniref:hypothetical protein n=1 Tax=Methylomonas sp. LWB TaxID=1905845 RepID=UPI0020C909D8|nr:hypothetical protein [Methylomonas sp. LWB]
MSDERRKTAFHHPTRQIARHRPGTDVRATDGFGIDRKKDDKWQLTNAGSVAGGVYLNGKYGQYVAWPEDLAIEAPPAKPDAPKLLTATVLGQQFELPASKMNYILSELGWIKKGLKGWLVTEQGLAMDAEQGEDSRSGIPYVLISIY